MLETAELTINLAPEIRDYLVRVSEKKKVSPSSLATEILQCCLKEEIGRSRSVGVSGPQPVERRRNRPRYNPEDIVADVQRTLEVLEDELPGFGSGDPLAAEVEAIISQVEAERQND